MRDDWLLRTLTSVCLQDYPPDRYEVVVADDAACDQTRELVESLAESSRCAVRYVPVLGNHGPAAARNCGWREAHGEIIAFTNDDCIADPLWLTCGIRALQSDAELAAVWGPVVNSLSTRNPLTDSTDWENDLFATANCFVRRRALAVAGGFDEQFSVAGREDADLYFRLLECTMKVKHDCTGIVVHMAQPEPWFDSLRHQAKRQFDVRLYRKHPRLYRQHIAPFPILYVAIVACALATIFASLLGASDSALLAGVLWASLTTRFAYKQLMRKSEDIDHHFLSRLLETMVTSIAIPWLAIFYRLVGWYRVRLFGVL